jgi:hypothetical protein
VIVRCCGVIVLSCDGLVSCVFSRLDIVSRLVLSCDCLLLSSWLPCDCLVFVLSCGGLVCCVF